MKIRLTSIIVDDQDKALEFYTGRLGFLKKMELPAGEYKWLTVVSAEEPDGPQVSLEPNVNPAAKAYQKALYEGGIPMHTFQVDDMQKEHERLKGAGVVFRTPPTNMGWGTMAVIEDTCGNLIMLFQA
ncbi:MAG: VOC family protein [Acidobacteria bacterium]|nr:VOC family protein [Acidobacteriota bacterium]